MKIARQNLDEFLNRCIQHYPNSLVMRYADKQTQFKLIEFMQQEFLPAWRKEILDELSYSGVEELDDMVILEGIHSRLYQERGFARRELEIFQESDPAGYRRFMTESAREIMEEKSENEN